MMPPQPHGNGSQIAVGRRPDPIPYPRSDADRILLPVLIYGRPADETAVIPVTPAQPQPINDGEPYNEHPWCRKKMISIGLLFGAGVLAGVPLGMVLLFVILMAKVAM